ncbi:LysR family transcriptional regulator [Skermanella stibiiresistens SB22]|uniref:LysR family transcriptional regulator n=2 Tax=Skermanella TaxID=204447 RepID=W9H8Q7_9PROT|nr:LysR family transcriptional regulator [Skermanella stibiiresistens SB22]
MNKFKAMTTFVCIADRGSLSAAADAMGASLPTVVRVLAALEADLGVRLFNRTTRHIALTTEGQGYLESCRNLLAAVEEAEQALRNEAGEPAGRLTITAPVLFGQMHVAPAVIDFVRRHDKVRCGLILADRMINLHEERVDVGVRIGPLEDSTLIAHQVGKVRRMVVASPDYLADRLPTHPRHLLDANCIDFSGAGHPWWSFEENGRGFAVPVTGNLEFNQVAPAIDACVAGIGFGMFLSYQVANHVTEGRLRIVLAEFEPPPRPVSVIHPHARPLPARTRAFVDWITAALRAKLGAAWDYASA